MPAPLHRMTKAEIVRASKWRCPLPGHSRHTGVEHWKCYLKYGMAQERMGFLDIETSNLKADYGIMFGYCIKPNDGGEIVERFVTKEELGREKCMDRKVIQELIDDIQTFDRVVTHYGTRFDIPFSRARAEYHELEWPEYGIIYHTDTYYMARRALCISSNRLENVCNHLFGESNKTRILARHWVRALQGDKKALEYIADHCRKDVIDLERVYNRLVIYTKGGNRSI